MLNFHLSDGKLCPLPSWTTTINWLFSRSSPNQGRDWWYSAFSYILITAIALHCIQQIISWRLFFLNSKWKCKQLWMQTFAIQCSLKIHQRTACRRRTEQCEPSDHKTCGKSSPGSNLSGSILATAKTCSRQETANDEAGASDSTWRKLRVLWPAANEKGECNEFESKYVERFIKWQDLRRRNWKS